MTDLEELKRKLAGHKQVQLDTDLVLMLIQGVEQGYAVIQTLTQDLSHWKHEAERFKEALTLAQQDFKRVNNLAIDQAQQLAARTPDTQMPRAMVSVHGTDACRKCDTGRITVYAASRWCTECLHATQAEKASRIHEDLPPFMEALKTTPLKNSDNT